MNVRKTRYIILGMLILIGIAIAISTTATQSVRYYMTVDELAAKQEAFLGKEIKVAGKVAADSLKKLDRRMSISFVVENGGKSLNVSYTGAVPDTFKEGAEVVLTGELQPNDRFVANHVLAKCASRFEEKLEPGFVPHEKKS